MAGWVCLHRGLLRWEWYHDSKMVHLFIYLLLSANRKDGRWQGNIVKRGQLITGRKKISENTGLSEQETRTCIRKLEDTGELTITPTSRFSTITICNYDKYQTNDKDTNQQPNQQPTNNQPATNHKQQYNKENKENKKDIPPYAEIVSYLNEKTGKKFKSSSRETQVLIKARYKSGFTVDDFKQVIDNKIATWVNDQEFAQYLRPSTLFGAKFEGYLNEVQVKRAKYAHIPDNY